MAGGSPGRQLPAELRGAELAGRGGETENRRYYPARAGTFDKRLGTTQAAYEKAFAEVVNRVLDSGYQVLALSTCTGIDSYNKDDRMVALNLRHLVNDPSRYHVVMDELNDLEMGKLLSACDLTVGTRLHSAIISMNFGTPAIAINYEHKSAGIMQQLGMPEMAVDIRHLLDGSLGAMVGDTLGQLPAVNERRPWR